jgi:HD-GYP domain-containing protein (c-di-GMP phosphodiesterase class II)
VHVADVFDALTSDRPYHEGRSADVAFAILLKGIGTEFDDSCVHALLRAREKGRVLTQRERGSQEPGVRSQELLSETGTSADL